MTIRACAMGCARRWNSSPTSAWGGEAATGAAALSQAAELKPDLILMDLHLPDMTGIEASRRILVAAPTVIIIIFSADADRSLVDEALQAGACGYVLKTSVAVEFVHAIELVMAGKLYLSSEVSAGILEEYRKSLVGKSQMPKPLLSERETQLLRFIRPAR